MERQTVRLQEGPLHGQIRHMHPTARMFTEQIEIDVVQREYGGLVVDVPQFTLASYRRVSDDVFVFCATQTAMGSPNPDFYKEENEMSETATPDPTPPAQPVPPVQEPEPEPAEPETETETETTEKTETETTAKEIEF